MSFVNSLRNYRFDNHGFYRRKGLFWSKARRMESKRSPLSSAPLACDVHSCASRADSRGTRGDGTTMPAHCRLIGLGARSTVVVSHDMTHEYEHGLRINRAPFTYPLASIESPLSIAPVPALDYILPVYTRIIHTYTRSGSLCGLFMTLQKKAGFQSCRERFHRHSYIEYIRSTIQPARFTAPHYQVLL